MFGTEWLAAQRRFELGNRCGQAFLPFAGTDERSVPVRLPFDRQKTQKANGMPLPEWWQYTSNNVRNVCALEDVEAQKQKFSYSSDDPGAQAFLRMVRQLPHWFAGSHQLAARCEAGDLSVMGLQQHVSCTADTSLVDDNPFEFHFESDAFGSRQPEWIDIQWSRLSQRVPSSPILRSATSTALRTDLSSSRKLSRNGVKADLAAGPKSARD